jgi:hypothetical protein
MHAICKDRDDEAEGDETIKERERRQARPVSMRLAITASGSTAFSTGPDPIIGTYMGPNGLVR